MFTDSDISSSDERSRSGGTSCCAPRCRSAVAGRTRFEAEGAEPGSRPGLAAAAPVWLVAASTDTDASPLASSPAALRSIIEARGVRSSLGSSALQSMLPPELGGRCFSRRVIAAASDLAVLEVKPRSTELSGVKMAAGVEYGGRICGVDAAIDQ